MKLPERLTLLKIKNQVNPLKQGLHSLFLEQVEAINDFRSALSQRLKTFTQEISLFYVSGSHGVGKTSEISQAITSGRIHTPPPFWFNGKTREIKFLTYIYHKHPTYLCCVLDDCHLLKRNEIRDLLNWLQYFGVKTFIICEQEEQGHGYKFFKSHLQPHQSEKIYIADLKERPIDLLKQIDYFTKKYHTILANPEKAILMRHPWTGNSRELRDTCYYLSHLNNSDKEKLLLANKLEPITLIYKYWLAKGLDFYLNIYGLKKSQDLFEQEIIKKRCADTNTLIEASHYLKIPVTTLMSKMKKHEIRSLKGEPPLQNPLDT